VRQKSPQKTERPARLIVVRGANSDNSGQHRLAEIAAGHAVNALFS